MFLGLLTLEDGTEGLFRNDIPATTDCGRMGVILVVDNANSSPSPMLENESIINAVFGIVVTFPDV